MRRRAFFQALGGVVAAIAVAPAVLKATPKPALETGGYLLPPDMVAAFIEAEDKRFLHGDGCAPPRGILTARIECDTRPLVADIDRILRDLKPLYRHDVKWRMSRRQAKRLKQAEFRRYLRGGR